MSKDVDDCKIVYVNALLVPDNASGNVILKLAAKSDDGTFSVWIEPPNSNRRAWHEFRHRELQIYDDEFFVDGVQVPSVPLKTVLFMFHAFLETLQKPVLLVEHSIESLSTTLMTLIQQTLLVDLFHGVIQGFTNIHPIRKMNPRNRTRYASRCSYILSRDLLRKNDLVLEHETEHYLSDLAELATSIPSNSQLILNRELYEQVFTRTMRNPCSLTVYRGLEPLLSVVPEVVLRKMARAGLSKLSLSEVFEKDGTKRLEEFLHKALSSKEPIIAADKKLLRKIVRFFVREYSNGKREKSLPSKQEAILHEPSSSKDQQVPVSAKVLHQQPESSKVHGTSQPSLTTDPDGLSMRSFQKAGRVCPISEKVSEQTGSEMLVELSTPKQSSNGLGVAEEDETPSEIAHSVEKKNPPYNKNKSFTEKQYSFEYKPNSSVAESTLFWNERVFDQNDIDYQLNFKHLQRDREFLQEWNQKFEPFY